MRNPTLLSILIVSALAACQDAPGDAVSRPSPSPGAAVPGTDPSGKGNGATVAITDGAGNSGPMRLGSLARLVVDTGYRGTPGTHSVRIDVLGPGGALYAQLRGSLHADSAGTAASNHPMEVQGTPIDAFHMTGTWQFVLNVDGARVASASLSIVD